MSLFFCSNSSIFVNFDISFLVIQIFFEKKSLTSQMTLIKVITESKYYFFQTETINN